MHDSLTPYVFPKLGSFSKKLKDKEHVYEEIDENTLNSNINGNSFVRSISEIDVNISHAIKNTYSNNDTSLNKIEQKNTKPTQKTIVSNSLESSKISKDLFLKFFKNRKKLVIILVVFLVFVLILILAVVLIVLGVASKKLISHLLLLRF